MGSFLLRRPLKRPRFARVSGSLKRKRGVGDLREATTKELFPVVEETLGPRASIGPSTFDNAGPSDQRQITTSPSCPGLPMALGRCRQHRA